MVGQLTRGGVVWAWVPRVGFSLAISGNTVFAGAYLEGGSVGAVYIYERNTGGYRNYGQLARLTASDGAAGDQFGASTGGRARDGDGDGQWALTW